MLTRVFIIEDNAFLRETLAVVIGLLDGFSLCGDAGSGEEAIEKLQTLRTDILLVDGSLPGMSGADFVREMNTREPDIPCLFFSGRNDSETVRAALEAGACGYVVKGGKPDELTTAMKTCLEGGRYVSSSVVGWDASAESSSGVS